MCACIIYLLNLYLVEGAVFGEHDDGYFKGNNFVHISVISYYNPLCQIWILMTLMIKVCHSCESHHLIDDGWYGVGGLSNNE